MSGSSSAIAEKVHSMQKNPNNNYACVSAVASTKKMALVAAAVFLVILLEVWVISLLVGVVAFPNGAPISACSDLRPFHGARLTGFAIEEIIDRPAPYVVKTSQIEPNSYEGVISGTIPFRAFMVQARIDGSEQVVGKFIRFNGDTTKTLACSQKDDTITHTNDRPKQQITFVWHVNDLNIPESRIHFVATVAKSYSEFWTNVSSESVIIGSPIKEMTTTSTAMSQSGRRWGPKNPTKRDLNVQGNQMSPHHHQHHHPQQGHQQWQHPPGGRPFLESEEFQFLPAMDPPIVLQPIPSTVPWRYHDISPGQLLMPRRIEPKTTSTKNPLVSRVNTTLVQEAPNLSSGTTGSRPSHVGWNKQQATAQSHEQHITESSRSLKQTTSGSLKKEDSISAMAFKESRLEILLKELKVRKKSPVTKTPPRISVKKTRNSVVSQRKKEQQEDDVQPNKDKMIREE